MTMSKISNSKDNKENQEYKYFGKIKKSICLISKVWAKKHFFAKVHSKHNFVSKKSMIDISDEY